MNPTLIVGILLAILATRVLYALYTQLASPLRDVPGPFLARFTKLWFFNRVRRGKFHHDNIALHEKYGPIVRVGPDLFSISTPDKTVYGIGSKFAKSDWYEGWKHPDPNRWTLFPDRDMKRHAETRKRFQGMYSMSALVSYEGYVDSCAEIFAQRLEEFAASGEVIDMAHWFQCYAFDVIGDITYSRRFGFLDRGEDMDGTMAALGRAMVYGTLVGIYAWVHPFMYKLMENLPGSGAAGRNYIMKFVQGRIDDRNGERAKRLNAGKKSADGDEEGMPQDFLDKITNAHESDPSKVSRYHIFMMGLSNIIAGSDTTAVSLSSILYNLAKAPRAMEKLREEMEEFERRGKCGKMVVTFKESQDMPYLQAIMKEALRMHAATGLPLWRVVPEGGAQIAGRHFPAGSVVGINTWVAHYDKRVFGEDAFEFRPERWIQAEKDGEERLKEMESYYMPVSASGRPNAR
jgi:cytochrome P450